MSEMGYDHILVTGIHQHPRETATARTVTVTDGQIVTATSSAETETTILVVTEIQRRKWSWMIRGGGETTAKEMKGWLQGENENALVIEHRMRLDTITLMTVIRTAAGQSLKSETDDLSGVLVEIDGRVVLRMTGRMTERSASETRRRSQPGWKPTSPMT
jgi:hypothetical protein